MILRTMIVAKSSRSASHDGLTGFLAAPLGRHFELFDERSSRLCIGLGLPWRARPASRLRFNLSAVSSKHVAEIERRRRIGWIAFHQDAVETSRYNLTSSGHVSR